MAATCVGAVVDDERLWRDCLRNCFGRSSTAIKAAQLHDDITCLSRGLKPALLLDYIRPDARALQQFLHSLSRHGIALPYHELAILSFNQDVFLTHVPTLNRISGRTIKFMNISGAQRGENRESMTMLDEDHSSVLEHQIKNWFDAVVSSLPSSEEGYPVISEIEACPVNLCSLYGWLVGYPVVYWFNEGSDGNLDNVELSLWTVNARNRNETEPCLLLGNVSTPSPKLVVSVSAVHVSGLLFLVNVVELDYDRIKTEFTQVK